MSGCRPHFVATTIAFAVVVSGVACSETSSNDSTATEVAAPSSSQAAGAVTSSGTSVEGVGEQAPSDDQSQALDSSGGTSDPAGTGNGDTSGAGDEAQAAVPGSTSPSTTDDTDTQSESTAVADDADDQVGSAGAGGGSGVVDSSGSGGGSGAGGALGVPDESDEISGGGAADAGAADVQPDGPVDAGNATGEAGGCSAPGLAFCDDFEAHAVGDFLDSAPWSTHFNGEGSIQIDDSVPAHSGTKSVRVNALGYQTFFVLSGAPAFPAQDGKLYVRTFIRLRDALSEGHNTFFESGPSGNTDPPFETRVGVMFSMLMINQPDADRGFLSNEDYYVDNMLGAEFPAETWACIEAYFDPAASEVEIWLDGVEITDLHRTDWQQDPVEELRFGYEKYAGPETEIWYDDIAVASSPIGCQ